MSDEPVAEEAQEETTEETATEEAPVAQEAEETTEQYMLYPNQKALNPAFQLGYFQSIDKIALIKVPYKYGSNDFKRSC